jgi:hypothetical protein
MSKNSRARRNAKSRKMHKPNGSAWVNRDSRPEEDKKYIEHSFSITGKFGGGNKKFKMKNLQKGHMRIEGDKDPIKSTLQHLWIEKVINIGIGG